MLCHSLVIPSSVHVLTLHLYGTCTAILFLSITAMAIYAIGCKPGATADNALANATTQARLQGDWQSADDPNNVASFREDHLLIIYKGKMQSNVVFEVLDNCQSQTPNNKGMALRPTNLGSEVPCYTLKKLSVDKFAFQIGDQNITREYNRIKQP